MSAGLGGGVWTRELAVEAIVAALLDTAATLIATAEHDDVDDIFRVIFDADVDGRRLAKLNGRPSSASVRSLEGPKNCQLFTLYRFFKGILCR